MAKENSDSPFEIIPNFGFNLLKFGATSFETKQVFGEPDETESLKEELMPESESLVYHYWKQGFSLFYSVTSNFSFTSAEIDNKHATMFGKKVFAMNEIEIIKLFKENNFEVTDSEKHEWGEKRVSFDEALVDLYFENGKLQSINFGKVADNQSFFLPN